MRSAVCPGCASQPLYNTSCDSSLFLALLRPRMPYGLIGNPVNQTLRAFIRRSFLYQLLCKLSVGFRFVSASKKHNSPHHAHKTHEGTYATHLRGTLCSCPPGGVRTCREITSVLTLGRSTDPMMYRPAFKTVWCVFPYGQQSSWGEPL